MALRLSFCSSLRLCANRVPERSSLFKLPSVKSSQSEGVAEDSSSTDFLRVKRRETILQISVANSEGSIPIRANLGVSRAQLDLLEQLTSTSSSNAGYVGGEYSQQRLTIREQLLQLFQNQEGDFTIPLGRKLNTRISTLTLSQKRNIKRQAYLDKVSRRDDRVFFGTIGTFVILPPLLILSIAILTGYVKLLP